MSAIPRAHEVAEACGKAKRSGDKFSCCCPAHPDNNPSLTIPDRDRWWNGVKCWSQNCPKENILAAMAAKFGIKFPEKKDKSQMFEKGVFSADWKYEDLVDGKWQIVFKTMRFDLSDGRKNFAQKKYVNGQWVDLGKNYVRPLYNKRAVVEGLAAKPRPVFVTEGEKCSDILKDRKFLATTNGGSTQMWDKLAHSEPLKPAPFVVVLPDLDEPGMKKALNVARSLYLVGIKVKLLVLPGLGPILKEHGKDIFDWFHIEGNTDQKLMRLVKDCPFWLPEENEGFDDLFASNVIDMAPKQTVSVRSPFAETSALEYFLKKEGDNIRFCNEKKGGWYWWCGSHWKKVTAGKIKDLVQVCMVEYAEALARFNPDPKRFSTFVEASQGKRFLMHIVFLAESKCEFDRSLFDANPYHLCVMNGVIDLRTKELLEHKKEYNCSKCLTLEYHPEKYAHKDFEWSEACPKWIDFQLYVFRDASLMGYFQRQAGYFLTGLTSLKILSFWHGDIGWNGKTVAKEVYLMIMGPYARVCNKKLVCVGGEDTKAGNPIQVLGYRLIVIDELDTSDKVDKGAMKRLTGRDSLEGAYLFEETTTFKSQAKLLMVANSLPYMDGTGDPAAWDRVQALAYDIMIKPEDRIDDYELVLFREEGEAILAWMVDGAFMLLNGYIDGDTGKKMPKGMNPPAKITGRTEEWRESFDVLGEFLSDHCNVGGGFQCSAETLFKHFQAFMKTAGYTSVWTKQRFGRTLAAKRFKKDNGVIVTFEKDRAPHSRRALWLNVEPIYRSEDI